MLEIIKKSQQAYGAFNNGEIIENKPIGFPGERGTLARTPRRVQILRGSISDRC